MQKRLAPIILSLFIALPLLLVFQNCAQHEGYHLSGVVTGQGLGVEPLKVTSTSLASDGLAVDRLTFTQDSKTLIYQADPEAKGFYELYAMDRDAKAPRALSTGATLEFQVVGPNVYFTGEETTGLVELFKVEIASGTRTRLSQGGIVSGFALTADAAYIYFLEDVAKNGSTQLYRLSLGASAGMPELVSGALASGERVDDFTVSGDKLWLRKVTASATGGDLYVSELDGSQSASVAGHVWEFKALPLGAGVVYQVTAAGVHADIYLARVSSAPVKLNPTLSTGAQIYEFQISATGETVVFLADYEQVGRRELYSRDLMSLAPVTRLSPALVAGGNVLEFRMITRLQLVNGAQLLLPAVTFLADAEVNDRFDLYFAGDLAGPAVRLNAEMGPSADVLDYTVSGDGRRLAFIADADVNAHYTLFEVDLEAGDKAKPRVTPVSPKDVAAPLIYAHDNETLLFAGALSVVHQRELYVAAKGKQPKQLSRSHIPTSLIHAIKVSPDNLWVAFAGEQVDPGRLDLFIVPVPAY